MICIFSLCAVIHQNNVFFIIIDIFSRVCLRGASSGEQIEPKNGKKTCRLTDACELRIAPHESDADHLIVVRSVFSTMSNFIRQAPESEIDAFSFFFFQFLHDVNDVITGTATNTLRRDLVENHLFFMKINIHETISSKQLRSLNADRRKCYFHDEMPLKYYDFYTENLCRIECRIDAAIKQCNCIPFFYSVGNVRHEFIATFFSQSVFFSFVVFPIETAHDVCDVNGMHCLSLANWNNDTCECYPSCDSISYTKMEYTQFVSVIIDMSAQNVADIH